MIIRTTMMTTMTTTVIRQQQQQHWQHVFSGFGFGGITTIVWYMGTGEGVALNPANGDG